MTRRRSAPRRGGLGRAHAALCTRGGGNGGGDADDHHVVDPTPCRHPAAGRAGRRPRRSGRRSPAETARVLVTRATWSTSTRLANAESVTPLGRTGLRRLRSRSRDARALVRLLADHPAVAYAEPNYIVHTFADPPDPLAPQLWGLQNVGQAVNSGLAGQPGADIHAAASVGRLGGIDGPCGRHHRHRHRLHASRPGGQSLVCAGAVYRDYRRRLDHLPGRIARLQRHRADLRSDGRPQPRHARRRHHRRGGRQRHRRGRRELDHAS